MANNDYRVYSITFYVQNWTENRFRSFEYFLRSHPAILGYWNYIPLVYLVKSRYNASQLAQFVKPYFGDGHFLVVQVDPTNVDGWLPQPAWEWFWAQPEKPAPVSSQGLGGLLSDLGKQSPPK